MSGARRSGGGGVGIGVPGIGNSATVPPIVTQGVTYTQAPTDTMILLDSSASPQAAPVLNMIAGSYNGQEITLKWWGYGSSQTPPTINAEPGTGLMEPFSGMAASGAAGLTSTGGLNTPGASWTLKWSGTYWLSR